LNLLINKYKRFIANKQASPVPPDRALDTPSSRTIQLSRAACVHPPSPFTFLANFIFQSQTSFSIFELTAWWNGR